MIWIVLAFMNAQNKILKENLKMMTHIFILLVLLSTGLQAEPTMRIFVSNERSNSVSVKNA